MIDTTDKVTLEEAYAVARGSSDLTVTIHRRTGIDYSIAAGCSHTPLSSALTDLRHEWDTTPKTPKKTEAEIQALADSYRPKPEPRKALKRARVEAQVWRERQLREQARRLPSRSLVLELLAPWVAARGIEPEITWVAVFHWLHKNCGACDGRGAEVIPDTPALGPKCKFCNGTGEWPETRDMARIKDYIKGETAAAHGGMKQKLRG